MKYKQMSISSNETISYIHCYANHILQCINFALKTYFFQNLLVLMFGIGCPHPTPATPLNKLFYLIGHPPQDERGRHNNRSHQLSDYSREVSRRLSLTGAENNKDAHFI